MKNKNMGLISTLSVFVCGLHTVMLYTAFNQYIYTSGAKFLLFLLCPVIYFALTKENGFRDLFILKGDAKCIKQSLLLGLMVFVFILVAFMAVQRLLDPVMIVSALSNVGITSDNYLSAFLYYLVVNVALEEIFFRGFVFSTLYQMDFKRFAYIFSSLLFALYHVAVIKDGVELGVLILAVLGLVLVGLLFNEITRRCKSIAGSLAVHASASLAICLVGVYYLVAIY